MQIVNDTKASVDTVLWEDLKGQPKLSVIVKFTFDIEKGKPAISSRQLPVFMTDFHYKDDPIASVLFETDRVPFKPFADVVLVGKAHAPGKRPVTEVDVTMRVGGLKKSIRVFGDRKWFFPTNAAMLPLISSPDFFLTMDLVYERAFGGMDEASALFCRQNLLGTGYIGRKSKESLHGKVLPNLEDPKHLISSWDDHPNPMGFGFFGRGWFPRLSYAGTYDERYQRERAPALPEDFSYLIFNGAHPDLQLKGYLRGDEEVELINLSSQPLLHFQLPGISPRIAISKWTVPPAEWIEQNAIEGREVTIDQVPTTEELVEALLDTLVFAPEDGLFYEVFRAVFPLSELSPLEIASIKITT